jgi:hypothetical protein
VQPRRLSTALAAVADSRTPRTSHLYNTSDPTIVFAGAPLVPVLVAVERDPEPGELRRD